MKSRFASFSFGNHLPVKVKILPFKVCCRQKTFNENETEKSPRTEWISINADEANYSYANYGVLIYKNVLFFLNTTTSAKLPR